MKMVHRINVALGLILIVSPVFIVATSYEGDSCTVVRDGSTGICTKAAQCPEAFQNPQIRPDLCMYTTTGAVICCPRPFNPQLAEKQGTIPAADHQDKVRISVKKCQEYSQSSTTKYNITALVVEPELYEVSISNCDFTTPLIVDGEKAKIAEFPHMAALGFVDGEGKVEFKCGGTLISDQYILTAAHCTNTFGERPSLVRIGDHNLASEFDGAEYQDVPVRTIINHPNYRRPVLYNDIALLQLSYPVKFGKFARPACLWQTQYINYTEVVATGWGLTDYAGEKSNELLKVRLQFYTEEECEQTYNEKKKLPNGIADTQLCAGNRGKTRADTCQGDSGGPIQVIIKNTCLFHVIGVTSFGKACGISNTPGVYTRVSQYLDWIESVVWPNEV